ncbi:MAG: alpha/beta hydrolase [Cyclobacteriaceae bacterium]
MSFIKSKNSESGESVKIFYQDFGAGQPVVLIHGWPLSHEMWEYQINDLVESGFRVIAYDRRGFGKSSKPWDGYDYDSLTGDLKSLLDELDLNDVILVGFSMGGGEVVRYFSRYGGERVSKVALLGSVTPFMLKTADNPKGVDQSVFDKMMEEMKDDRIGFLDSFGKQFFGVNVLNKPVSTPLLEYYRMLCTMASPRATQECAKSFSSTDFREEMSQVNVPTLIIHGDADKTVPIEPTGEQSADMIPDANFIRYEGAPHGFFYTEKQKLNKDLISFIREQVLTGHANK